MYVELTVDAFYARPYGALGDMELLRRGPAAVPLRDQPKHVLLALSYVGFLEKARRLFVGGLISVTGIGALSRSGIGISQGHFAREADEKRENDGADAESCGLQQGGVIGAYGRGKRWNKNVISGIVLPFRVGGRPSMTYSSDRTAFATWRRCSYR